MGEEPPDHMTIPEIRRYTGVSRTTIYRWIKAGKLKPVGVSSAFLSNPQPLFARADVERLKPKQP